MFSSFRTINFACVHRDHQDHRDRLGHLDRLDRLDQFRLRLRLRFD